MEYRNENGPFRKREDLMNINRFGEKAFEQAAGFLRIRDGENPLDSSAVHPESYPLVEQMARDLSCPVKELIGRPGLDAAIDLNKYITPLAGLPTLTDILHELEKPGRDPRTRFEPVAFAEGIHHPSDLKVGMKVPGIVTNVTNFGAFVDIGVHQEGLVHISHLSDQFVKDPNSVVAVGQRVDVTVIEVDPDRQRIALSMKSTLSSGPAPTGTRPPKAVKSQRRPGEKPKAGSPPPPRKPEQSIEEKLAQLMNKYRKK